MLRGHLLGSAIGIPFAILAASAYADSVNLITDYKDYKKTTLACKHAMWAETFKDPNILRWSCNWFMPQTPEKIDIRLITGEEISCASSSKISASERGELEQCRLANPATLMVHKNSKSTIEFCRRYVVLDRSGKVILCWE